MDFKMLPKDLMTLAAICSAILIPEQHLLDLFSLSRSIQGAILIFSFVFIIWLYHCYLIVSAGDADADPYYRGLLTRKLDTLSTDNGKSNIYISYLSAFLDKMDLFFGSRLAWSATTYDRSIILALFYPILCIFIIWVVTGDSGEIGRAIFLEPDKSIEGIVPSKNILALFFVSFSFYTIRQFTNSSGILSFLWLGLSVIFMFFSAFIMNRVLHLVFDCNDGMSCVLAYSISVIAPICAFITAICAFQGKIPGIVLVYIIISFAAFFVGDTMNGFITFLMIIPVLIAIYLLNINIYGGRKHAIVLGTLSSLLFLLCFLLSLFHSTIFGNEWKKAGAMLLFLGVLTIVNAVFDFAAIGSTRYLLRLGVRSGAMWPYFLAIMDIFITMCIITILFIAVVLAVDGFNLLATIGPGCINNQPSLNRLLPEMHTYLTSMRSRPWDSEFWWLYAILFTTMVPCLCNVAIASFCIFGEFQAVNRYVIDTVAVGRSTPVIPRLFAAIIISVQNTFTSTLFAICLLLAISLSMIRVWTILWPYIFSVASSVVFDGTIHCGDLLVPVDFQAILKIL